VICDIGANRFPAYIPTLRWFTEGNFSIVGIDRFYVGQTALPPEQRLEEHNSARNENSFTTTRPKNE